MATWGEDFADAMGSFGLAVPGTLEAGEAFEFISSLKEYVDTIEQDTPAVEVMAALSGVAGAVAVTGAGVVLVEAAAFAVGMTIATYLAALLVSALYASAKQGWDYLSAPIDLEKLREWAKEFEAPVLDLPVTEAPSWYPTTHTEPVEAPPAPPPYPGHVIKCDSTDTDSVERIQQVLEVLGYEVSVDGDFQDETKTAVEAFQADQGLEVDGEVGKDTWKALFGS
jgi:murein L,D-transpeptidase YcbB/YkuD